MMKLPRLVSLLLAAALITSGPAQSQGLASRDLDRIPLHVLSGAALSQVRDALPEAGRKGPARLAVSVPMALGLDDGIWIEEADVSVWRSRVYSAGATLLVAYFDRLSLPEGGELRFSDVAGTTVQGPYTQSQAVDGGLWTALVPGEEALIEIQVPGQSRDQVDLALARLGHGVYPLRGQGVPAKSGGCNIDVACPQANAWRDQLRSAVRLQIPTGLTVSLCSGQLMNNSAQNNTPYVLTANHCGISSGGLLSPSNAGGVVAYFNYETSSCGGTPDGSLTQTITGSILRFNHSRSDHSLIELSSKPPSAFDVYYSGFDASAGISPTGGASLHHPSGDEKRISLFNTPAPRQTITLAGGSNGATTVDAYTVKWSQGVTELGSSGGGLWNQHHLLVGVLSGGSSACDDASTAVDESSNPDHFGRLDVAWANGINQFLDPDGSGRVVAGKNPANSPVPTPTPTPAPSANNSGGGGALGGSLVLILLAAGVLRRSVARTQSRSDAR